MIVYALCSYFIETFDFYFSQLIYQPVVLKTILFYLSNKYVYIFFRENFYVPISNALFYDRMRLVDFPSFCNPSHFAKTFYWLSVITLTISIVHQYSFSGLFSGYKLLYNADCAKLYSLDGNVSKIKIHRNVK